MKVPDELRRSIARDLRPVRPHLRPWQRLLLLLPAAALAFVAGPGVLGLRSDIATVGPALAWLASLVELAVAVALMAAALRESVPGEAVPAPAARLLLASAALLIVVVTLVTSAVSPEPGARAETFVDWLFCWRGALLAGLPLLLALVVLVVRGLPMRPALAGALAGMAAGMAADGGWRLYCNYSSSAHVLPSHGGAVVAFTALGMAACVIAAGARRR